MVGKATEIQEVVRNYFFLIYEHANYSNLLTTFKSNGNIKNTEIESPQLFQRWKLVFVLQAF